MRKPRDETLNDMEKSHPGIGETIRHFESADLPVCPRCGSKDTATVGCGIVGRSINVAAKTKKFKLIPNGPKPGEYFCNRCEHFFN